MSGMYTVYMHQSPSGKRYIGITRQDLRQRCRNGEGYKNCTAFYHAIRKYGWENIEHYVLKSEVSERTAKSLEREYIAEYQTNNKRFGYNCTSGGDGVPDWRPNAEQRAHNRETKIRLWENPEFRERLTRERQERGNTPDERERLRKCAITTWEDPEMRSKLESHLREIARDPELRKIRSEKIRLLWEDPEQRIRFCANRKPKAKGGAAPTAKAIRCISTGDVFTCGREAAAHFGISYKEVSACATGRRQRTHGLQFEFV